MFNKVIIIGNLTRDPELRYTPGGVAVCNLRIASNSKYVSNGEPKEEVMYIDVVVWGRQAETTSQYMSKGSTVLVDGRLQERSWETDGTKRTKHEIVAQTVKFLSTGAQQGKPDGHHDDDVAPF